MIIITVMIKINVDDDNDAVDYDAMMRRIMVVMMMIIVMTMMMTTMTN